MTTDDASPTGRSSPVVCGVIGTAGRDRAERMTERLGRLPAVLDSAGVTVFGSGDLAVAVEEEGGVVRWSGAGALPDTSCGWRSAATAGATGVVADGADPFLHGSLAGSSPVFVEVDDSSVAFSTSLDALVRTRGRVVADRDAWADVLAVGAPLRNRTIAEGVERLPPWSTVRPGGRIDVAPSPDWPWFEAVAPGTGAIGDLVDALRTSIGRLADSEHRFVSLLSGGWDSRVLAALAVDRVGPTSVEAWTTSSDIGTTLDELVASEVACRLGVAHHVVAPRVDDVVADIAAYAVAVHHLSSFHVWLVPLVEELRNGGPDGCVLDGLGGGVFLDSAFESAGVAAPDRFEQLARYASALPTVLRREVADELVERARASFSEVVGAVRRHAGERHELDAYLTRTLPGISLGPCALVAGVRRVATPFLDATVVQAASALPAGQRRDGGAYRGVLAAIHPELSRVPTAAELTGARRAHRRRISSRTAAAWYRDRLRSGPLADVLAPALSEADIGHWQTLLDRTATQHVIRSLGTWSLWMEARA